MYITRFHKYSDSGRRRKEGENDTIAILQNPARQRDTVRERETHRDTETERH